MSLAELACVSSLVFLCDYVCISYRFLHIHRQANGVILLKSVLEAVQGH